MTSVSILSQTRWKEDALVLSAYRLYEWMVQRGFLSEGALGLGEIVSSIEVQTEAQVPLAKQIRKNGLALYWYTRASSQRLRKKSIK